MQEIINKVELSGIMTIDLLKYKPHNDQFIIFDIVPYLLHGYLLQEKVFRAEMAQTDWSFYKDKEVILCCSNDAIVPYWAYVFITSLLQPYASLIIYNPDHSDNHQTDERNLAEHHLTEQQPNKSNSDNHQTNKNKLTEHHLTEQQPNKSNSDNHQTNKNKLTEHHLTELQPNKSNSNNNQTNKNKPAERHSDEYLLWADKIRNLDYTLYTGKKVVLKASSAVPPELFVIATRQLMKYVQSLMWGEAGSPLMIYKKKKTI